MLTPIQARAAATQGTDQLACRFAFEGALAQVLRDALHEDATHWKLSSAFRGYYFLRRWIPLGLRQWLQQRRNRSLPVDDDWYCPRRFLKRWQAAVDSLSNHPPQPIIHPWPDGCDHAVVLTHDIESHVGLSRALELAEMEERFGLRSAWYVVPAKYDIDPGVLRELQRRGHEVGLHGYNHDGQLFRSPREFGRRAKHINAFAQQWQAVGFRAPMMHRHLAWMQSLDIDYDSSCFDSDPYQAMPGGVGGVWPFFAGRFVELPLTLPQDHTLFVTLRQTSIAIWEQKHALLRKLRGMSMSLVHPDYLNSPADWERYRRLLEHLSACPGGWQALPREVAQWWRERDASRVVGSAIEGPARGRGRIVSLQQLFE